MNIDKLQKSYELLEKRLRVAEDKDEIRELQNHYIDMLSIADWDRLVDCFSEDCTFIYGPEPRIAKGKTAVEKLFREFFCVGHYGKDCDIVVHPVIKVYGNEAEATWTLYQFFSYQSTGQLLFLVRGVYDMKYVREKGRWKISYLKIANTNKPPAAHAPFPGV